MEVKASFIQSEKAFDSSQIRKTDVCGMLLYITELEIFRTVRKRLF